MHLKVGKFNIQVTPRRKDFLLVILWTAAISLIMIKAHILLYQTEMFRAYKPAFLQYRPPSLEVLDMLILTMISMVVTFLLSDVKPIVYGFAASLCLSFIIAVAYTSLFIWYVLDWRVPLSQDPFGWELAIYVGFRNMIFVMVPWVIGTSVMGLVVGVLVRGWIKIS